jgi:outer membrane protein OmpA-like peptidoglycan-associated protein
VAIIGYGFTGATSVTIGGRPAGFKVINDATVEVTMPAADAPGSADVAVNLTAARGRAFAPGGYVYQAVSASTAPPIAAPPPSSGTSPAGASTASSTSPATATLLGFKANSAVLTPAVKAKLSRIAESVGDRTVTGTVITYRDKRGTAKSTKAAQTRARNVVRYLDSLGVDGDFSISVRKGQTAAQRRGVLVRLTTDPQARATTDSSRVSSLLVKFRKDAEPTSAGLPLTVARSLGLRMYRLDFARPVTLGQAQRAAAQLARDRRVEFAEPDGIVTTAFTRE